MFGIGPVKIPKKEEDKLPDDMFLSLGLYLSGSRLSLLTQKNFAIIS